MPWDNQWMVDRSKRQVTPLPNQHGSVSQNDVIQDTLLRARTRRTFQVLDGWRDERYAVRSHGSGVGEDISMERAGSPLFGINTYGVHMTVFTQTQDGLKIWVPRRARTKQTYGGMLDNSVAGGLAFGEVGTLDCYNHAIQDIDCCDQVSCSLTSIHITCRLLTLRDQRRLHFNA